MLPQTQLTIKKLTQPPRLPGELAELNTEVTIFTGERRLVDMPNKAIGSEYMLGIDGDYILYLLNTDDFVIDLTNIDDTTYSVEWNDTQGIFHKAKVTKVIPKNLVVNSINREVILKDY